MTINQSFQLFNLATMSGVFPGARTQTFQRLRLQPLQAPTGETRWAQVLWYADPAACVVYLQNNAQDERAATPLLRLAEPLTGDFNQQFQTALHQAGWQLQSCGSCRFWQILNQRNVDQLPTGRCVWQQAVEESVAVPALLATQTNLALSCPHWQLAGLIEPAQNSALLPQQMAPMRKAAEISESKLPYWHRAWKQLIRWGQAPIPSKIWEEKLIERSGVGAGTEACFACQGRIANLGALAVETAEGDKQTFSVWRCRTCYTTYLNNWIDRWERLDNLETEETYYRVAPAEALALLIMIDDVVGGDHPGRRRERHPQRGHFLHFMQGRTPLSHQIKQGR
ncbi:MAG: hypothetical protein NT075_13750 [Chloroflexi bacterium]|nr:hypothetical protein [Chloroflexota bacterium]